MDVSPNLTVEVNMVTFTALFVLHVSLKGTSPIDARSVSNTTLS
jgi:hypothetical protein